jgi:hypothetical protein
MLDLLRDLIVTSAISVLVLILLASTIGGIERSMDRARTRRAP